MANAYGPKHSILEGLCCNENIFLYLLQFNKLEIWVKPIVPEGSLAVVLLNTATFGSGTPISLQADSVSMTDTRGYNVIEAFTGQSKGLIHPTDQLNLFVTPTSVYMMICKINA